MRSGRVQASLFSLFAPVQPKHCPQQLLFLPVVGHQIELCARDTLELRWPLRAGKIVADAERIPIEFVDGGERLAPIWPLGPGNGDALGLRAGVERVSASVRTKRPT